MSTDLFSATEEEDEADAERTTGCGSGSTLSRTSSCEV